MNSAKRSFSRRSFLRRSAVATAAASQLPRWFLEECAAAPQQAKTSSPNGQPAVALVGCGGMGRHDAQRAAQFGRLVAVCDVDRARAEEARKPWPDAKVYSDFREVMDREDIDAVICGTVDHWHTLISMAAMRSGKDVYCEKPLTLTIDEGKRLVRTARETGRILQTGSQQRSEKNFRLACELVRNGRIGKVKQAHVWLPAGRRGGPFETAPVPERLDWDYWQGPTGPVEYVPERCHGTFRYWWEYSGGTMTDWGAHHHDIALWGLGMDRSGPMSIEGEPLVEMIPGGYTAASEYAIEYVFDDGVRQTTRSTSDDDFSGRVISREGRRHGVKFEGSDGWIWVTRGNIEASDPEMLVEPLPENAVRLYESSHHMGNFFACMQSRKQPICDVEIGHRAASVCHLGVISMRLGRKLNWDPVKERFVDDGEADGMLSREMRKPYSYEWI